MRTTTGRASRIDTVLRWAGLGMMTLILAACGSTPDVSRDVPVTRGVYKVGQPYEIRGQWFYPREDWNYDRTGVASWYGKNFHGRPTANGETYNMFGMTAAHPTLPLPVNVEVTNLRNGKKTILRVNDRGPFARGRILDVSWRAAEVLGFREDGTAPVRVKILGRASLDVAALDTTETPEEARAARAVPVDQVAARTLRAPGDPAEETVVALQSVPDLKAPTAGITRTPMLYVQAAAFTEAATAQSVADVVRTTGLREQIHVSAALIDGESLHRVLLGPFDDVDDADEVLDEVIVAGYQGATIIAE